jgi:hypothetical protein
METASTGAVDVFLKRDDISEESKKEIRIKSPDNHLAGFSSRRKFERSKFSAEGGNGDEIVRSY